MNSIAVNSLIANLLWSCAQIFTKNTQGNLSSNIYLAEHFSLMMDQSITMQKSVLLLTFFFIFCTLNAQYYYNDVVDLKASNNIYANLLKNNIHEVSAISMGSDNTPTAGFLYSKILKNNATLALTHTELETGGVTNDYDTYANGRLVRSSDSADNVLTTVEYTYDNDGKILTVQTRTDDTAMNVHSTEIHKWFYSGNNPDSMIKIKDRTDTTVVRLVKDENGNIAEEIWMKKGRMVEHYFYYYNDKNQLTDIVRFNNKAQQMLPDFLLEYNDKGIISQITQVPQGSSDYVIWQYVYDERGLKIKDVLYDKRKELLGTVIYTYK
jgi:antitoxin component YwqK of YwqJK toxin-antitoxin module